MRHGSDNLGYDITIYKSIVFCDKVVLNNVNKETTGFSFFTLNYWQMKIDNILNSLVFQGDLCSSADVGAVRNQKFC